MTITDEQTLLQYLKVSGAYQPAAIPGEHAFTFLSKESGLPQVWKWDGATAEVRQYTNLEDRVLSVNHSPSGKKTVVGMDHQGNEKQQLYLLTNDLATTEELVVKPEYFHEFGGWSPDETKIVFASNRRHPGFFDIFLLDLETKTEQVLFEYDGKCTPVCWTKDGSGIVLSIADTNIDNTMIIVHTEKKEQRKIGKSGGSSRNHSLALTKDGKGGYLLSDSDRDTLDIVQFSTETSEELHSIYTVDEWDVEELKLSPSDGKLAFTVNEGGYSRLAVLEPKNGESRTLTSLPKGVYQSLSWLSEEELLVGVKSPLHPGDIWKVQVTEDEAERLTFVGEAEEIAGQWRQPELLQFTSFDGLEVPYFYYGDKGLSQPVVVYVHGGPESQIRAEYNPVVQYLASKGFAVVTPNVRGSMGYGRKYVQLDDVRKRMDAVADLKWLVEDLVANHGADRSKVGIMGRSYGGFMVLAAVTHYPDVWAAGVDIVGISHFRTFLENTGPWRRKLREFEYGSLDKDTDFFDEIAPLNHTDKITAPLLVFHGRNDTRVPVSEAEQLTADLKEQGKEVELVIFEDEGHQTERIENHIHMNRKTVEFMEQYL
ncbi:S9 family peptidase [Lentibacillus sediminis]|uniref:S9 family peptidase n=1 Tax=Lentibacillus sediminis TaxID=1940529 RepID=UPI000C1C2C22|nr:S9 family peptidase [Lentibacillus sediminis]